jgi:HEXXH motif-containing protein
MTDLTGDLVEAGWQSLFRKSGLIPSHYGTTRAVAQDALAPLNVIAQLSTSSTIDHFHKPIKVEILDISFAQKYKEAGIKFYTAEEIGKADLLCSLQDAINIVKRIPTLLATVVALVRSLHLIKPENDDYDVSFSEPHIPFSIFVSVPQARSTINTLRLAEAIVHEAMHLQLTLIEKFVPLVIQTQETFFSPWREECRPIQGVLHALYVFRVIHQFWELLSPIYSYPTKELQYIQLRQEEINRQINKIRSFQDCSELTMVGACFVRNLIQN